MTASRKYPSPWWSFSQAGLRTSHIAFAEISEFNIETSTAAESCPFANILAEKNKLDEILLTDVRDIGKKWATP